MDSASMIAIVINEEVVKTKINFLIIVNINLNNGIFFYNYNI